MNCFQIVKSVLDDTYAEIPGHETDKNSNIKSRIESLRDQYHSLSEGVDIDYRDPITRFAYIYVYVTSHANMVCQIIDKNKCLKECFSRQELIRVSCIGGGPGSDLLGILKYVEQHNTSIPNKIKCYLVVVAKEVVHTESSVETGVSHNHRLCLGGPHEQPSSECQNHVS